MTLHSPPPFLRERPKPREGAKGAAGASLLCLEAGP